MNEEQQTDGTATGPGPRELAAAKREGRIRRIRALRRRVAGVAAALFLAIWGVVFAQSYLAAPVSGSSTSQPPSAQSSPLAIGDEEYEEYEGDDDDEDDDDEEGAGAYSAAPSTSSAPTAAPAPVTTSQS